MGSSAERGQRNIKDTDQAPKVSTKPEVSLFDEYSVDYYQRPLFSARTRWGCGGLLVGAAALALVAFATPAGESVRQAILKIGDDPRSRNIQVPEKPFGGEPFSPVLPSFTGK